MSTAPSTDILLQVAMRAEAQPIIDRESLQPLGAIAANSSAHAFANTVAGRAVVLVTHGVDPHHNCDRIGPIAAATTCAVALARFTPRIIVNIGTCGGFRSRGGAIGDLHLPQRLAFHDQRVPIPGFREFARGEFETPRADALRTEIGALSGLCSTGGSLDATPQDRAILDELEARCKDMEAAAIAFTARDWRVPLLALKCVTDLVDHPEAVQDAFLRNLRHATMQLATATTALLRSNNLPW
ncbi:MAG: hypothetical protein ACKO4V_09730 [Planctomycetota bacterium]